MLKALIVEDEKWAREGLRDFLKWKELGIERVETAGDGIEGLELAQKILPDIVITDIKMPGMDGIRMSQRIRESLPQAKIIILTGYDDFQLAREAVSLKADAYLLKPLEEAEITPVLQKAVGETIRQKERSREEIRVRRQLEQNRKLAQTQILNDLLNGAVEPSRLGSRCAALNLPNELYDEYTVAIIRGTGRREALQTAARRQGSQAEEMERISSLAERILGQRLFFCLPVIKEGQTVFCLARRATERPGREAPCRAGMSEAREITQPAAMAHEKMAELFQALPDGLKLNSVVGIGAAATGLAHLSRSYAQAQQAVEFGVFWSFSEVVAYHQVAALRKQFGSHLREFLVKIGYFSKRLLYSIAAANPERVFELLKELFRYLKRHPGAGRELTVNYLQTIISETAILLCTLNKGVEALGRGAPDPGIQLTGFASLAEIEQHLTVFFENALQAMDASKNHPDEQITKKVIALIETGYRSELGLRTIAREVYLSPNYLGNIFKKCTGKTFNDYLCEFRMAKAKELLAKPGNKVSWVAAEVGIANTSYFCTVFKHIYGIAPGKFQETVLRGL